MGGGSCRILMWVKKWRWVGGEYFRTSGMMSRLGGGLITLAQKSPSKEGEISVSRRVRIEVPAVT